MEEDTVAPAPVETGQDPDAAEEKSNKALSDHELFAVKAMMKGLTTHE